MRKGFTLAEVLITLGIIGVVAAMTIPTLMNNIQDSEFHTAAKKAFSTISNATERIVYENSGTIWDNSSANSVIISKNMADEYAKYFSFITEDTNDKIQSQTILCYKSNYACMPPVSARYALLLKDGMTLKFYSDQSCSNTLSTGNGARCGDVMVDTNGNKPPNMYGRDVFDFFIVKDNNNNYKVVPAGKDIDSGYDCIVNSSDYTKSLGCTEYVINNQPLPQ